MAVADLLTRPATITRRRTSSPTTFDAYGNPDMTETTTAATGGVHYSQIATDEPAPPDPAGGYTSASWWRVYLDASETDLAAADLITVDGLALEVVGDPQIARNPRTGAVSHVEARARSVT